MFIIFFQACHRLGKRSKNKHELQQKYYNRTRNVSNTSQSVLWGFQNPNEISNAEAQARGF